MFTGLIEQVGTVASLDHSERSCQLRISAPRFAPDVVAGESIAVNGCCLTVTAHDADLLAFDLLNETLERTNLGHLRNGSAVNLERALRAHDRFGGHFVQGHIDCTARIVDFAQRGADRRLEIELPSQFARYVAVKGSIAVDGISLTVAELLPKSFVTWIIPHTKTQTNLGQAASGQMVNLEFDILAKYAERMLKPSPSAAPLYI